MFYSEPSRQENCLPDHPHTAYKLLLLSQLTGILCFLGHKGYRLVDLFCWQLKKKGLKTSKYTRFYKTRGRRPRW